MDGISDCIWDWSHVIRGRCINRLDAIEDIPRGQVLRAFCDTAKAVAFQCLSIQPVLARNIPPYASQAALGLPFAAKPSLALFRNVIYSY